MPAQPANLALVKISDEEAYLVKQDIENAEEMSVAGADVIRGVHRRVGEVTLVITTGTEAVLSMPRDKLAFLW